MDISSNIEYFAAVINGWPLTLYVVAISVICSCVLNFIQVFGLFKGFKLIFKPSHTEKTSAEMPPLQAFINTLSTNLGNGSIAGMATAVYAGGPGAAFWVVIFGIIMMSVRFAEVYIGSVYSMRAPVGSLGGPMLYMQDLPAGKVIAYIYAIFCLLFGFFGGNAIQANSIRVGIESAWGIPAYAIAAGLLVFVAYVVSGGARRIAQASDYLVPLKVILFFGSTLIILTYHAAALPAALLLIVRAAFDASAVGGALFGITLQQTIRYGANRSIFATESGLGTAAVLFGATGSQKPLENALMGMISTFISTIVCFIVALCIVVSGVWTSGLTSTALTIASYETVFGMYAPYIVNFLAISFGIGCVVSYAYVVRVAWHFLFNGKCQWLSMLLYCLVAFFGALTKVDLVWNVTDLVIAAMLGLNLFAILYLLPRYRSSIMQAMRS